MPDTISDAAPAPVPIADRADRADRPDAAADFDFLHGTWRVHNRRLRHPLSGSADWYAFDGRAVERPIWGGRANLEEYEATLPDGAPIRGLALRLHDPHARHWTIHWAGAAQGRLDPPMVGTFRDGVGEFFGEDRVAGRTVLARFRWTALHADAARWEQAYSDDGGRTWETNWIMEFTRAPGDGA